MAAHLEVFGSGVGENCPTEPGEGLSDMRGRGAVRCKAFFIGPKRVLRRIRANNAPEVIIRLAQGTLDGLADRLDAVDRRLTDHALAADPDG